MKAKLLCCITTLLVLSCSFSHAQNAEVKLLENINPTNPNSTFWRASSGSAYPVTIIVEGGLLLHDYYHSDSTRKIIIPHIATKLIVLVATEGLKLAINRERPYSAYPSLIHPYTRGESGQSFPSAHTSLAFNTAATLGIRFKKWCITVPAYIWAGCVGYSRLYLGEHYPTDVLAGAAIGIGSAYLTDWFDRKVFKTRKLDKAAIIKTIP